MSNVLTQISQGYYHPWPAEPIHTGVTIVTPPSLDPITVLDAKVHARIDVNDDDAQVRNWIRAATRKVERDTQRYLLTQTIDYTMDAAPMYRQPIRTVGAPLQSVTSIKYYDATTGSQLTMTASDYIVDVSSTPGRIGLADAAVWPTGLRQFQPITIRMVVGWASAAAMPDDLQHAVRLLVGHYSENRQVFDGTRFATTVPQGYEVLIDPYIVPVVG